MSQKRTFSQVERKSRRNVKRTRNEQSFEEKDRLHFQPIETFERKFTNNEINAWKPFMYPQRQPITYEEHQFYTNLSVNDIPSLTSDSYQEVYRELIDWSNMHLKVLGWKSNQTKYYPVALSNGKNELKDTIITMLKLAYKQRQIVDQQQ